MTVTPERDDEEITLRDEVEITLTSLRIASEMSGDITRPMIEGAVDMVMAAIDRHRPAPALPSTAQVTEYQFDPLGGVIRDAHHWRVRVRRHRDDRWSVHSMFEELDETGAWNGGNVTREHIATFPLDEALRLAEAAQWTLGLDGKTARDVLADRGEGS